MKISVIKRTGIEDLHWACGSTQGKESKASLTKMYAIGHSPIRTQMFRVEITGVETFVSVHLVRHKIGIEHYVRTNRDDLNPIQEITPDRYTPIYHGMWLNAAAIIAISQERLCYKAHRATVAAWTRVRKAMKKADSDLVPFMVPKCVYRNGLCPEASECHVGLKTVLSMYPEWPGHRVGDEK